MEDLEDLEDSPLCYNFTNASQPFGVWGEADLATSFNSSMFEILNMHLCEAILAILFVYIAGVYAMLLDND